MTVEKAFLAKVWGETKTTFHPKKNQNALIKFRIFLVFLVFKVFYKPGKHRNIYYPDTIFNIDAMSEKDITKQN